MMEKIKKKENVVDLLPGAHFQDRYFGVAGHKFRITKLWIVRCGAGALTIDQIAFPVNKQG